MKEVQNQAEVRVRDLLEEFLGPSMTWAPDFRDTPRRVAAWLTSRFHLQGPPDMTSFPLSGYASLVTIRDIPVRGLCPHHLLPYSGHAHVAYLPHRQLIGLSKIPRLVTYAATYPKMQEVLTAEIADQLFERIEAKGVFVSIHADHTCMTLRGACAMGSKTVTTALRGEIDKEEVLQTLRL